MITSIDLATIVYRIVNASSIRTVISGDVYLGNRPANSAKSDIVIGALNVPNTELQESVALISIYAKDLYDGKTYSPNLKLLNQATKFLLPLFKDLYIADRQTYLDVEYVRDYQVNGVQEWVSTIRLKTRTINI